MGCSLFVSLYLCQCVSVIEDSQKTGAISSELEVPVLQIIFWKSFKLIALILNSTYLLKNSNLNCSWNLTLLNMINFVTLCQSYHNVVIFLEIIPKKKYCNTHQLFFKGLSFLLSEDYSTLFSCYLSLMDLNLTKPVYLFPG